MRMEEDYFNLILQKVNFSFYTLELLANTVEVSDIKNKIDKLVEVILPYKLVSSKSQLKTGKVL